VTSISHWSWCVHRVGCAYAGAQCLEYVLVDSYLISTELLILM
jgi:hypothetical protein